MYMSSAPLECSMHVPVWCMRLQGGMSSYLDWLSDVIEGNELMIQCGQAMVCSTTYLVASLLP
jgi:hypothetical protein